MTETIDKNAILNSIIEKLNAPIPSFWKANIKLGKTTELEYYSKIIVGQTFCGRQKDRLKRRLILKILKDLNELEMTVVMWDDETHLHVQDGFEIGRVSSGMVFMPEITKLKMKWEKLK